jgi:hypothetical protein
MNLFDWIKLPTFIGKKQIDEREISRLELYLDAALHPIQPRSSFVTDLKTRLQQEPIPVSNSNQVVQYAILGLAGVVSGLIIFVTGLRATVTLLGAIGILRHAKSRGKQNRTAAA